MPLFEKSEIEATYSQEELPPDAPQTTQSNTGSAMDDLLGLGDIGGGGGAAPMMATNQAAAPAPQSALDDLLGGLGGGAPPVMETGF